MKRTTLLSFAIALFAATAADAAVIPDLYNTGVDDERSLLAGSGAVDPHYTMTQSPDAGFPGPDAVTLSPGFPVPPWVAEGPDSRWIAPQAAAGSAAPGEYRFTTTFDLTGFDESTASISGDWAVDNEGTDILLNGFSTGNFNGNGFAGLTAFNINSGFVAGVNTLVFIVTNAGVDPGPIGLRVKMRGTVDVPGEPPSILESPVGATLFEGEQLLLTVAADGADPLSYQWQLDGEDIDGATTDTYTVGTAVSADSGDYTVIVSNDFGTATSDPPATVIVGEPVSGLFPTGVDESGVALPDASIDPHYQIAVNPDSESPDAIVEDSTVFPIVAGPWVANDGVSKWIGPAFDTASSAGGDYTYRVTFDLTGYDPATAFIRGTWATDNIGADILINGTPTGNVNSVTFTGLTPFSIAPGSFVSGINTLEFLVNNAAVGYTGLRVTDLRAGAVPGTGGEGPPMIVRQPMDQMAEIGAQARFSVLADGAPPLTYQWRFEGNDLGGATGPELTIFNVSEGSSGDYDVVVSNGEGSQTSEIASLTILRRPPEIIMQPADQFAVAGESATLSVVADGTMPIGYQWRFGGDDLPGETAADLTIDPVSEADAGEYDVVLTNADGTLTSDIATLTVLERITTLFNTGVDENGVALFDNAVDPHYTLTANANGAETEALAMGAIPSPPWVPNTATSRWIGPTGDSNGAPGLYTFQTTFDLLGFDPDTVVIKGQWISDNTAPAIRLNGVATGITGSGNFGALETFTINSGFVAGLNTLAFDVDNAGAAANPVGLRIEGIQALGAFVGVPDFRIISISRPEGDPLSVTFTWNSLPGRNYRLEFARSPNNWLELNDEVESQGELTTFIDTFAASQGERIFYRAILLPPEN